MKNWHLAHGSPAFFDKGTQSLFCMVRELHVYHSNLYTLQPKLLCDFKVRVTYKCGCQPHITAWRLKVGYPWF